MIIINEDTLIEKLTGVIQEETRKIIQEETRKIVQEETRKIVQEETPKIVQKEIKPLAQSVNKLQTDVSKLQADFNSLHGTVARMEYEFGYKIDILCDYAKISIEKFAKNDKDFEIIYKKLDNHSMRISNLEDFQKQISIKNK